MAETRFEGFRLDDRNGKELVYDEAELSPARQRSDLAISLMATDCIENSYDDESGAFIHVVVGNPGPDELNDAVAWRNEHPATGEFVRVVWDLTRS